MKCCYSASSTVTHHRLLRAKTRCNSKEQSVLDYLTLNRWKFSQQTSQVKIIQSIIPNHEHWRKQEMRNSLPCSCDSCLCCHFNSNKQIIPSSCVDYTFKISKSCQSVDRMLYKMSLFIDVIIDEQQVKVYSGYKDFKSM